MGDVLLNKFQDFINKTRGFFFSFVKNKNNDIKNGWWQWTFLIEFDEFLTFEILA